MIAKILAKGADGFTMEIDAIIDDMEVRRAGFEMTNYQLGE